jgi:hypothetical protein
VGRNDTGGHATQVIRLNTGRLKEKDLSKS